MYSLSMKKMRFSLVLISVLVILLAAVNVSAKGFKLKTITGEITNIHEGVITLNEKKVFYPAMEIDVPDWAEVGAKVSMSYDNEKNENRYYEIVKPGEKFKVKEELERLYNEPK